MAELTQDQERAILAFRERMDAAGMRGDALDEDQILWLISLIERPVRLEPGRVIDLEFPGDGGRHSYSGRFIVGNLMFFPNSVRQDYLGYDLIRRAAPQTLREVGVQVDFRSAGEITTPADPEPREIPEVHRLSTRNERHDLANIAEASLRGSRMEPRRFEELIRAIRECPTSELDFMRRRVRDLHRFYLRRELDEPEA